MKYLERQGKLHHVLFSLMKLFPLLLSEEERGWKVFGVHSSSERIMSQLLTEMDGIEEIHNIVVIAATNRVDMIDTALLRPGRFDKIVYIPNPDKTTREKILQIHR